MLVVTLPFVTGSFRPKAAVRSRPGAGHLLHDYTGRENDGTGGYYYRARYYSPSFGRFISGDPIGLAGGLDIYAYVRGNPLSGIDPLGLFDILAYSQWMNDHAHTSSQHQCAKYVRRGLEAGDADTTGHPSDANNYGLTLTNNGFTPIPSENYTPQAGDAVVFQPISRRKSVWTY